MKSFAGVLLEQLEFHRTFFRIFLLIFCSFEVELSLLSFREFSGVQEFFSLNPL